MGSSSLTRNGLCNSVYHKANRETAEGIWIDGSQISFESPLDTGFSTSTRRVRLWLAQVFPDECLGLALRVCSSITRKSHQFYSWQEISQAHADFEKSEYIVHLGFRPQRHVPSQLRFADYEKECAEGKWIRMGRFLVVPQWSMQTHVENI